MPAAASSLFAEVLEAAAMRKRLARAVEHRDARGASGDGADSGQRNPQLGGEGLELFAMRVRRREKELVVVAAGKHAVTLELGTVQAPEHRRPGNALVLHARSHRGALGDVGEVAGEPVG